MAQDLFMEELMERIRSQVKTEARSSTPAGQPSVLGRGEISATDRVLSRLLPNLPSHTGDPTPSESYDLNDVRVELENCLTALEKFGEVNPRPPGFMTDRIQNGKGFLRRTLIWYTKPLRGFHRAVIRAMQQMVTALEKQRQMMGDYSAQSDLHAAEGRLGDLELVTSSLYEVTLSLLAASEAKFQAAHDELKALREELHKLRDEVAAIRQQGNEALTRHSSPERFDSTPDSSETDLLRANSKRVKLDQP